MCLQGWKVKCPIPKEFVINNNKSLQLKRHALSKQK